MKIPLFFGGVGRGGLRYTLVFTITVALMLPLWFSTTNCPSRSSRPSVAVHVTVAGSVFRPSVGSWVLLTATCSYAGMDGVVLESSTGSRSKISRGSGLSTSAALTMSQPFHYESVCRCATRRVDV